MSCGRRECRNRSARMVSCPVAPAWRTRPTVSRRKWATGPRADSTSRCQRPRPAAGCPGGIAVASALLGQPVGLADGGVQVDRRRVPPQLPRHGPELAAHPVPAVTSKAQESAQCGWRFAVQSRTPAVPPETHRSSMQVASGDRGKIHHLGFARPGASEVMVPVDASQQRPGWPKDAGIVARRWSSKRSRCSSGSI